MIASYYRFRLTLPAPCDGWFFQKVTAYKKMKECPCTYHDCKNPEKVAEYWEWFGFAQPEPGWGGDGMIKKGEFMWGDDTVYNDEKKVRAKFGGDGTLWGGCGVAVQENEVRFYCKKDLLWKTTPGQGTFPEPFGSAQVPEAGKYPSQSYPWGQYFWNGTGDFNGLKPIESRKWRWQANWESCCAPGFASFRATYGHDLGGRPVD